LIATTFSADYTIQSQLSSLLPEFTKRTRPVFALMAKQGGGIGRVGTAPSSELLAANIARVEARSPKSGDGPFGSTKSGGRTFEIYSDNPHVEALDLANQLGSGGRLQLLSEGGWVRVFSERSAVTFRPTTTSVKDMPGVTLTVRNGKTREVYEIHYLQRSRDAN
jgi:hypothetical protein